ncbi:IclR family transcriptional regulator domain-containing protein [Psychrobacter lutiphocae]|uniref:IclR family transcriptional regulator domain-containing protein n=1 Tax=Psychrobacter lutiphocae TaxID=540500 RepID=UPI00036C5FD9|nr:IclR family transcriptional regulator C-terminal domain-containing protein [Psychrobacter lutiphocae]
MSKIQDEKISFDSPDFVASLAAGLSVLQTFDENNASMTLSEVAEKAQIGRAKARRYLLTLHALGYVHKDKRQFSLTPKTLSIGARYLSANHHHEILEYYLERVTEQTGESCSFGILDDTDIVYIARSAAEHRLMAITLSIGTRLPAAYTSMGRAILANLSEDKLNAFLAKIELKQYTPYSITDMDKLREDLRQIKEKQFVILNQELDKGLLSLAIPVYKANHELIGAINISTNALRVTQEDLQRKFLPILQECANNIQKYYI